MSNFAEQSELIRGETPPDLKVRDTLERRVFRSTLVVLATLAGAYVLWLLVDLLLLLFACALVALILLTVTNSIRTRTRLPFGLSLMLSVLGLMTILGGAFWFFGATMQGEFAELATRLPAAWADVQGRLQTSPVGASILDRARGLAPSGQMIVNAATTAIAAVGGALSLFTIVLIGGLYLAAQPTLYATGLLRMIPSAARTRSYWRSTARCAASNPASTSFAASATS